jgi:ABC-2 type transport system ATP-binding protein
MKNAIEVKNLVHSFGARRAIDGLSFEVRSGEVFGLLGPNGAGKTTSVRLLNGLYKPAAGSIRVLGLDPFANGREIRRSSGVLTETPALYERLSGRENLRFFGAMASMPDAELRSRVDELLESFDLTGRAADKVSTYSKGMKQRLALARALLTRPQVLYLDEPTSGLDPESALQVRDLIQTIRQRDGHTVFLCTHHLEEAEKLCDRVAVMHAGRFLALGSLADLAKLYQPGTWVEVGLAEPMSVPFSGTGLPGILELESGYPTIRVHVESEAVIPVLVSRLVQAGAQIRRVEPLRVSLEEIYFKLQNEANGRQA